jgi:DNA segregation ATPase FtsK/SpoIIIE-like protein
VLVKGRVDAVIQKPDGGWCAVEFKSGDGNSEADLAQLCLYQEMLRAARPEAEGSLALLRFGPGPSESFLNGPDAEAAQQKLRALIGRLAGVLPGEADVLGEKLLSVLGEYKTPVRLNGPPVAGPTFIRYSVTPEHRVPVAAVCKQGPNLQIRLGCEVEPLFSRDASGIAIDLQRPDRQTVHFRDWVDQISNSDTRSAGRLLAGVTLTGEPRFIDFSNPVTPHVLVAGAAGSGKSEWMRMALASMLVAATPDTLRLVLIDPKRNAFGDLKKSPFLLTPSSIVYPPEDSPVVTLEELVEEMESRYKLLEAAGADDLGAWMASSGKSKPRIVCVCDEFADLLAGSRKERQAVEALISRLGQKARAAGIHLILATQQPSRKIVSGVLQTNLACRVALKTSDATESRMIGCPGAEKLLGHGDLFLRDVGEPLRLQSPFLAPEDRQVLFAGR